MFGEEDIMRLNIKRFEQLLTAEADPARQQTLARLLDEARAELVSLSSRQGSKLHYGAEPVTKRAE